MIVLKPYYSDMRVVVLGASVPKILKTLKSDHWEDELEYPDGYDEEHIKDINKFFKKKFKSVDELMDFYNQTIDEDYKMERG
jgi:hypothetical protein